MRVLFATHSFPRFEGDAPGSFVLRLAQALRDEDVHVQVIAPSAPGLQREDEIGGIPVTRVRYAPTQHETLAYTGTMAEDVSASWTARLALGGMIASEFSAIVRSARRYGVDLLHAHWWFPNGVAAAAANVVTGIPLVTTSHGSDIRLLLKKPAASPLARFVFGRSAAVTCVSQWLASNAAAYTSSAPIVAPMPVNAHLFSPAGTRDAAKLLFVGRLSSQKGGELAVRALARMERPATLDIVGAGPESDRIIQVARELGVGERVTMLGSLGQEALADCYRRSAALVVPSSEEGLGLVAVEAQLCGTPVVAFASGGLMDVVIDERTGLLVPPGDVDALATTLDRVLSSPELREKLGCAGRESALARFTPAAAAAQYASIYRSVLERHAA
ncbi:MAG: glycosyltransferase [Gemmatimonadaceae bacterium]